MKMRFWYEPSDYGWPHSTFYLVLNFEKENKRGRTVY